MLNPGKAFFDPVSMVKACSTCKAVLQFSEFSPQKKGLGGRLASCKQCYAASMRHKRGMTPRKLKKITEIATKKRDCTACKNNLPFDDFYLKRNGKHGRYGICKKCMAVNDRCKRYGITADQYQTMLDIQDGLCLICGDTMQQPCVDHCHKTGKVRGLLCGLCNTSLGGFGDSVKNLEAAISYLRKHSTAAVVKESNE